MKNPFGFLLALFLIVFCYVFPSIAADDPQLPSESPPTGIVITEPTSRTYEDLDVLCRIWGFLKYNHPEVAAGKFDWDMELFTAMGKIMECGSPEERNELLYEWIGRTGFTDGGYNRYPDSLDFRILPPHEWIKDTVRLGKKLSAELRRIECTQLPETHFYIGKKWGINVLANEKSYGDASYADAGYRLLALFRYWNAVQYFFPYIHMTDEPWDEVLREFIPKVIHADTDRDLLRTYQSLSAAICDGHSNILFRDYKPFAVQPGPVGFLPVSCLYLGGEAVVSGLWNPDSGFSVMRPGDVITSVDGATVEEMIQKRIEYIRTSNVQHTMHMIINMGLFAGVQDTMRVGIKRDGKEFVIPVDTSLLSREFKMSMFAPPPYGKNHFFVDDSIGYIHLGMIQKDNFEEVWEMFRDTRGMILDIRGYPDINIYECGSYFFSPERQIVTWYSGKPTYPGAFLNEEGYITAISKPIYKGKLVLLVNEYSISRSEFTTMALQCADDVVTLGSQTAGADGEMRSFNLPFGMTAYFTHLGVAYPDGTETQRIGVKIDEIVVPTIESLRDGRDPVFERAVEIIQRN